MALGTVPRNRKIQFYRIEPVGQRKGLHQASGIYAIDIVDCTAAAANEMNMIGTIGIVTLDPLNGGHSAHLTQAFQEL